jgi:hypothetical protein
MTSWRCKEKEGKWHRRMNQRYLETSVGVCVGALGTLRRRPNSIGTVGWTDGPYSSCVRWLEGAKQQKTVSLSDALFESRQRRAKRFNSTRWTEVMVSGSIGLSDGLEEANSKVLAESPSALDEAMHRLMKRQSNYVNGHVQWRVTTSSTGWTDAWKSIASDYPMVLLSTAFSQRLFGRLGLFIPPPLTHLRLMESMFL